VKDAARLRQADVAIIRIAAILIGLATLLAAAGFACRAAYLWNFTPCRGNAEYMGSFVTLLLLALALLFAGGGLVTGGRIRSVRK
jgi:uncharacterized membrane protein